MLTYHFYTLSKPVIPMLLTHIIYTSDKFWIAKLDSFFQICKSLTNFNKKSRSFFISSRFLNDLYFNVITPITTQYLKTIFSFL